MTTENVYQATIEPADTMTVEQMWEIHVAGVGVTQVQDLAEATLQATSLVSILHPELDPASIRIEFVRP